MADLIGEGRLETWLGAHAWTREDGALQREWTLDDFAGAVQFVNAVAGLAESQGHHPDIALHSYNKVRLRLTTHSSGGITENDLELAERVDELQ
ncbi:4a-hydroxytetrahydrobiopterin dehydratase [Patulibacter minatonensis]|uniref:4a-hydroxytetrahydrobiopterin dehydratase n=1 Tax=Patulibacter minatonensis TaxID=298163 RepID=UPI00047BE461|nr:4a-hydroxytetrahydrobiopterin dehydratase [Patulibacter minatonensis]